MPTEQCNFRCLYCYEDFSYGRMSSATVAGLKALITRRAPELSRLSIEWFGGEPLLAYDVVDDLQTFAHDLGRAWPSLAVTGSMTTNASLLHRDRLRRLTEIGLRHFQITLDGPREHHNGKRLTAAGKGSFDTIWRNLEAARSVEGDFVILLRVHVNRDNFDLIRLFLTRCHRAFGSDPRFKVSLRSLRRLGGPNDETLPTFATDEEEDDARGRLQEHAEALGFGLHLGPFEGSGAAAGCYAAAANSFVIRSNGDVAKCTVALRHPNNRVGRLCEDGSLEIDGTRFEGWIRGLFSGEVQALRCPMVGYAEPTVTSLRPDLRSRDAHRQRQP